jgi:transaldolase
MSIIQNIRDKGAWIIFTIIVIALIAFVLQDGIGKQGNTTVTDLGTVNGVSINKINFEEKLEIQVQNYASQGIKREQLIGFLWNQEVDRLLYINEQEKLGITVATPILNGLDIEQVSELMKKAGIKDYEAFAKDILLEVKDKSISFEVFSDDLDEMEKQALKIATWGENVYVKIPITNTKGIPTYSLIKKLSDKGVKVNVTAIMTLEQVRDVVLNLNQNVPSYVSVFAGRIADTGVDPVPLMSAAVQITSMNSKAEVIWASPRELLNVFQADEIGCQIITVTNDILKKLELVDYDLSSYSLDTVKMFYNDAVSAGFKI